eukprot:Amastigsp_a346166_5.p3 type:complete len:120 gc:universal Amastigsp_a346166_5:377-18(-)
MCSPTQWNSIAQPSLARSSVLLADSPQVQNTKPSSEYVTMLTVRDDGSIVSRSTVESTKLWAPGHEPASSRSASRYSLVNSTNGASTTESFAVNRGKFGASFRSNSSVVSGSTAMEETS